MSRSVTVITAREVYRYKMAYHGDKFLHIGAVTIVSNTDHTLHYAMEEELQSRTFFINSAVGCSGAWLLLFQRTYSYTKGKNVLYIVWCLRFVRT